MDSGILPILLIIGIVPSYFWLRCLKDRLPGKWWVVLLYISGLILFALLCAKLLSVIEFGSFSAFSGMRIFGCILLAPLGVFPAVKPLKWKLGEAFDALALCEIHCMVVIRVLCFINGCCEGKFIPGTGIRWPLREAEMLLFILFLIIYVPRVYRGKTHGEVYPLMMMVYGLFRLCIEGLRVEYVSLGVFHVAHVWALLSVTIGASIYLTVNENHKKARKPKGLKL